MNETLIPQRCIENLRKSFFLMALLFLFTALFPIQKQLSYGASEYSSLTVLTSRQVTFFLATACKFTDTYTLWLSPSNRIRLGKLRPRIGDYPFP